MRLQRPLDRVCFLKRNRAHTIHRELDMSPRCRPNAPPPLSVRARHSADLIPSEGYSPAVRLILDFPLRPDRNAESAAAPNRSDALSPKARAESSDPRPAVRWRLPRMREQLLADPRRS